MRVAALPLLPSFALWREGGGRKDVAANGRGGEGKG